MNTACRRLAKARVWVPSAFLLLNVACASADSRSTAPPESASATNPVVEVVAAPVATAADYTRVCGICHLEDGAGVPGAFPPLDQRLSTYAASDAGRNYLVGLLKNGLYGQITVNGTTYNGAMPPLGFQLDTGQMAAMLNYVLQTFAGTAAGFTTVEITDRQSTVGNTAGATLRATALTRVSE